MNKHAVLYVAFKELDRALKDEKLPPGTYDVSGASVTVQIPDGVTVTRDAGPNGDGKVEKKATQNLYGFALWALFLKRLESFNQAAYVRRIFMEALRDSLKDDGHVETELREIAPDVADFIDELRKQPLPTRKEDTTRNISKRKTPPDIQINSPLRQAG